MSLMHAEQDFVALPGQPGRAQRFDGIVLQSVLLVNSLVVILLLMRDVRREAGWKVLEVWYCS